MARERETDEPDSLAQIAEAMRAIAELQKSTALPADVLAEAFKKANRPSNEYAHMRSAFNPRGERDYPMPRLKCEMFIPYKVDPESHGLDWEEVELLNKVEPGQYRVELNDGATVELNVLGVKNEVTGELERLEFRSQAYNKEQFRRFPALRLMLRDMLEKKDIEHGDVLTMRQMHAKIKSGELAVSR